MKNVCVVIMASILRTSGVPLGKVPSSLAAEIIGRLNSSTKHEDEITNLLEQCNHEALKDCALLPAFSCFDGPQEALLFSLEGHCSRISDMIFTNDDGTLYSVDESATIASWDLSTGELLQTVSTSRKVSSRYCELILCSDSTMVCNAYTRDMPLFFWDGQSVQVSESHAVQKKNFIHNMIVFPNTPRVLCEGQIINAGSGDTVSHIENLVDLTVFVTAATSHSEEYIFVGKPDKILMVNIVTGKEKLSIKEDHASSHMLLSEDDSLLIVGFSVSCQVHVYNVRVGTAIFGSRNTRFDYKESFPNVTFREGERYCQEVSEMSMSHRGKHVLANMRYCHIFIVSLDGDRPVHLDDIHLSEEERLINASFNHDDSMVLATSQSRLVIWSKTGSLLSKIQLPGSAIHNQLILPSPVNNTLVTVSKVEPVLKVWDLEKLQNNKEPSLYVFSNPVDIVAIDPLSKLLYIKTYYRLDSPNGYHYIHQFGLDVWNIETNEHTTLLPKGEYGNLKMIYIPAGNQQVVGLLIHGGQSCFIYIISVKTGEILKNISSSVDMYSMIEVSPDGKYVAGAVITEKTQTNLPGKDRIKVWKVTSEDQPYSVEGCRYAVFTLDCLYVLLLAKDKLIVRSLCGDNHYTCNLSKKADRLQIHPNNSQVVLTRQAKCYDEYYLSTVHVYDYKTKKNRKEIQDVALYFTDISKDGRIAVDVHLQIYNLDTGDRLTSCWHEFNPREYCYFRYDSKLTYTGCHVIFTDTSPAACLKVFNVESRRMVATVNTHSPVVSINVGDYGFTIIAGCEDGHLLILKLHQSEEVSGKGDSKSKDQSASQVYSSGWSHDGSGELVLPAGLVSLIHPLYHISARSVLPDPWPEHTCQAMVKNMTVPRTITLDIASTKRESNSKFCNLM